MDCQQYEEEAVVCSHLEELFSPALYRRSSSDSSTSPPPPCILLRACLVVAKLFSTERNLSLQDQLRQLCDPLCWEGNGDDAYRGLKIITCSRIPSGSGLGGSSILAAVILKSIFHLLCPGETLAADLLVRMVGQIEQLLTTGGGWQDQVGGIYPGFKLCQSQGTLESPVTVRRCFPSQEFLSKFSQRTCLIYSGVQVPPPSLLPLPLSSSLLLSLSLPPLRFSLIR
jgi:fucokinase